jgi:hypothetical protein
VPPGPQQGLLHEVLGPLPVAVDQPQGMRVQRVGVLVVQGAEQVGVVVADDGLLASTPSGGACTRIRGGPDRFSGIRAAGVFDFAPSSAPRAGGDSPSWEWW